MLARIQVTVRPHLFLWFAALALFAVTPAADAQILPGGVPMPLPPPRVPAPSQRAPAQPQAQGFCEPLALYPGEPGEPGRDGFHTAPMLGGIFGIIAFPGPAKTSLRDDAPPRRGARRC